MRVQPAGARVWSGWSVRYRPAWQVAGGSWRCKARVPPAGVRVWSRQCNWRKSTHTEQLTQHIDGARDEAHDPAAAVVSELHAADMGAGHARKQVLKGLKSRVGVHLYGGRGLFLCW